MQKYTFGKNAIIRIAKIQAAQIAADGAVTKPPVNDFVVFCLPSEVTIGSEWGTTDIASFCTGGNTISVRDGSKTGKLELGNVNWVRDDPAIVIMRAAVQDESADGSMIYVEVLPEGQIAAGLAYDFVVETKGWEMKIPAKGLITAAYTLNVLEGPNESVLGVTNPPGGAPVVLASGVAATGIGGAPAEIRIFTISAPSGGDLTVTTTGGTGNANLRVKDVNGTVLGQSNGATNEETVSLTGLAAGTYAVEVVGVATFAGVSLTATVA